MADTPCTCIIYRGTRWDDQDCPHPEHGPITTTIPSVTLDSTVAYQ